MSSSCSQTMCCRRLLAQVLSKPSCKAGRERNDFAESFAIVALAPIGCSYNSCNLPASYCKGESRCATWSITALQSEKASTAPSQALPTTCHDHFWPADGGMYCPITCRGFFIDNTLPLQFHKSTYQWSCHISFIFCVCRCQTCKLA